MITPKYPQYELSKDGVGLLKALGADTWFHIHSNEFTTEEQSIRDYLQGRPKGNKIFKGKVNA